MQRQPKQRTGEVWVAVFGKSGFLLPPMDDDGTDLYLAWPSKVECERGIEHQNERWGFTEDDPSGKLIPMLLANYPV